MSKEKNKTSRRITLAITIILTGIIAGTADAAAALINAWVVNEVGPVRVFQYIASGVFGKSAFSNDAMAIWGVFFHYAIATSWALIFFLLYNRLRLYKTGIVINSIAYGIVAWVVMNRLVLPLTNVTPAAPHVTRMIVACLILIIAIGFPISYMAHRFFKNVHKAS